MILGLDLLSKFHLPAVLVAACRKLLTALITPCCLSTFSVSVCRISPWGVLAHFLAIVSTIKAQPGPCNGVTHSIEMTGHPIFAKAGWLD
jgi:hypothetical protein